MRFEFEFWLGSLCICLCFVWSFFCVVADLRLYLESFVVFVCQIESNRSTSEEQTQTNISFV